MANIDMIDIKKRYEGNEELTVKDFSLHVKDGEFIVFVGPSGCGKSTILRMIAGLEEITAGELYINEELMNHIHPKDRGVAMVFQNYALFPFLSVRDNIGFGLKIRGADKDERNKRIEEAAELLGLTDHLDKKPSELSGGQRQRVALGRAIVNRASIFLMDEPLSNLDAKLRIQMREEIVRLHKKLGATTIYVTHDQVEAMTMANRIVILDDGIIQQIGSPEEVYNNPSNLFVAGFIGSPPMNFLNVKADGEDLKLSDGQVLTSHPRYKMADGREMIAGIRPETVEVEEEGIPVTANLVELLGADYNIHTEILGEKIVVTRKAARREYTDGEELYLKFPPTKVYLFDKETGERLRDVVDL